MQEKGRCRGAVNKQPPVALDLGDETVKGEIVHIKVKNDLDCWHKGVCVELILVTRESSMKVLNGEEMPLGRTSDLRRWAFCTQGEF